MPREVTLYPAGVIAKNGAGRESKSHSTLMAAALLSLSRNGAARSRSSPAPPPSLTA